MEKAPRANYNNSAGDHLNENGTTFSKGERINEYRIGRNEQIKRDELTQNGKMEPRSFLIKLKKTRQTILAVK